MKLIGSFTLEMSILRTNSSRSLSNRASLYAQARGFAYALQPANEVQILFISRHLAFYIYILLL
jgi:hypothetical protein